MAMQNNRVTGGQSSMTLYAETGFKTLPAAPAGVRIPIISEGFTVGSNLQTSPVMTGKRGPAKPFAGAPKRSGSLELPANPYLAGLMMMHLCGAPQTTEIAGAACTAGPVQNLGNGLIGLPCSGHGYDVGVFVSIVGTANYDGLWMVEEGTTADVVAIRAGMVAETLDGTETIHRGRVKELKGAATDLGGGKVGLPARLHGLNAGDQITVSGSTGYDGNYTVESGTTANMVAITKVFAAETFAGAAYVIPRFFRHAFALPRIQPTFAAERRLDFDPGAEGSIGAYDVATGVSVNGLTMQLGGESILSMQLECLVGGSYHAKAPMDASPDTLPLVDFGAFEVALMIDGQRRGDIADGQFSAQFAVAGTPGLGSRGEIAVRDHGDPEIRVTMNAFLVDRSLQEIVESEAAVRMTVAAYNKTGDELRLELPETTLDTEGAAIKGKGGQSQSFTAMAYAGEADSMMEVVVINRKASY